MTGFTGERPGRGAGYDYDDSRHQVAYERAATLVAGCHVVDAGSGDGAGTALLARAAARVDGLDHDAGAVRDATRAHDDEAVGFRVADLADPWPVAGADVVVAFQIIEHFEDDDAFLRRALAAVRPGGRVIITTPNVLHTFSENPYHVREYTPDEFMELLARQGVGFEVHGVYGNERVRAFDRRRRAEVQRWLRLDPLRLRDRLPDALVERAFAILSTLVRRRASGGRDREPITTADFTVRPGNLDDCLDYFAVLTK